MNIVGIIPARMGASRFPGKPLEKILGMPMVGHVFNRAKLTKGLSSIYVATCDTEIRDYVNSIGGLVIMTGNQHERPTERVIEAVEKIEQETGKKVDAAIMIQGDEPTVYPENIQSLVDFFVVSKKVGVVNLVNRVFEKKEFFEKDIVKLFVNDNGIVTWFFRLPNPFWENKLVDLPVFIQTGIIGFSREKLSLYKELKSSSLEKANSVDMFRFLENGEPINTLMAENRSYSVDTKADLQAAEDFLKNDELASTYL